MLTFLLINNISVDVDDELIEETMVEVATDIVNKDQLASWLRQYGKKLYIHK